MTETKSFYGWKLVGILWFLDFLNMGFPYYGGTVINTYMRNDIVMSRSMYGLGFTLLNLFVGLPSLLVAAAILRCGIRWTFALGSSLILAGALWLSLVATRPWHYLLGFGVLAGTGISFGTIVPAATAVTRWFVRYRGRAMAVTLSASGFAGFFGAPLINRILAATGGNWRLAWLVVSGVTILSGMLALLFVKERPEDFGQVADGRTIPNGSVSPIAASSLVSTFPWTARQAYGTAAYWMIVIGGIASQFPFFFFVAHGLLHFKGTGISSGDAAWAIGLLSIAAVGGRLIGGWLMDRFTARLAFALGLGCYLIGSALALHVGPNARWIAFLAAVFYGTAFGWTFVCLNTSTAHFYGSAAFPTLNGTAMLLTAVFCSPAGFIGGKLFDLYRSYTAAFEINMILAGGGIVALLFATMPAPPERAAKIPDAEAAPAS